MRGGIKMKRLIAALSVFMCFNPLHADNFGPDDKILYFSSDVLINVIKNTFDEKLQLAVARKYVDLMDENGNVSISDLVSICDTGKLDNIQCRGFIQSLIDTTDGSLKTFYWADYVGKGNITGLKFITGDGYSGQSKYIGPGGWYVQFDWTHDNSHSHDKAFKLAYPGSNAIIGTSACTNEPGTPYIADNTKNFASNEQTGEHCWCKMIGPEETHWIYLENVEENNRKYGINTTEKTGCARKCASDCLYEIKGQHIYKDVKPNGSPWSKGEDWVFYHLDMQKAMFTAIKLNKSIANVGEDGNTIEKDLLTAVTPPPPPAPAKPKKTSKAPQPEQKCEVDWRKLVPELEHPSYFYSHYHNHTDDPMYIPWTFRKEYGFQCKYGNTEEIKFKTKCVMRPWKNDIKGIDLTHTPSSKLRNGNVKYFPDSGCYARIGDCYCRMESPEATGWVLSDTRMIQTHYDHVDMLGYRACYNPVSEEDQQKKCDHDCKSGCVWEKKLEMINSLGVR